METAVKFLQNPSISNNPQEKKISFLRSKGLTEAQINEALSRVHLSQPVMSSQPQV